MAKKRKTRKKREFEDEELRGRPSVIDERIERAILRLAEKQYTDEEICQALDFHPATLYRYKGDNPEFREALKKAKCNADEVVERALFKIAVGYEHPETKVFCTKDGDVVTHETVKIYPPNPSAIKMWLTNRNPERWRERLEHDIPPGGGLAELVKLAAEGRRERDARKKPAAR